MYFVILLSWCNQKHSVKHDLNIFIYDLLIFILCLFPFNIRPLILVIFIFIYLFDFFLDQGRLDQYNWFQWCIIFKDLQLLVLIQQCWVIWNRVTHFNLGWLYAFFVCFRYFYIYIYIICVSHFLFYILLYAIITLFCWYYIAIIFDFYQSLFFFLFFVFLLSDELILWFLLLQLGLS